MDVCICNNTDCLAVTCVCLEENVKEMYLNALFILKFICLFVE